MLHWNYKGIRVVRKFIYVYHISIILLLMGYLNIICHYRQVANTEPSLKFHYRLLRTCDHG
jgi:hypothetical protein